jgi:hypothetical protein
LRPGASRPPHQTRTKGRRRGRALGRCSSPKVTPVADRPEDTRHPLRLRRGGWRPQRSEVPEQRRSGPRPGRGYFFPGLADGGGGVAGRAGAGAGLAGWPGLAAGFDLSFGLPWDCIGAVRSEPRGLRADGLVRSPVRECVGTAAARPRRAGSPAPERCARIAGEPGEFRASAASAGASRPPPWSSSRRRHRGSELPTTQRAREPRAT